MKARKTKLQARTSLTNNTTDTFNIDVKGVVSRIMIEYEALNGDNVPDGHPNAQVEKIEIVDGSDVLASISGRQAVATDFYDSGQEPGNIITYVNGNKAKTLARINFGRYLWDRDLGLDPSKFKNLQLKVTHNYNNGGSSCSASYITVWADVFSPGVANPRGFLSTKELYEYNIGSDGSYEYIDMPTDFPYRKIEVFGLLAQYQPWQLANTIRIDEDNQRAIPIDESSSDLLKLQQGDYGEYHEGILLSATTADQQFFCTPTYETYLVSQDVEDNDQVYNLSRDSYGGDMYVEGEGAGECCWLVKGGAPHGCIVVPFGVHDDITTWYDPTNVGSLQLRIEAGGAGSGNAVQVVTQQMRSYR